MAITVISKSTRGRTRATEADEKLIEQSLKRFQISHDSDAKSRAQGLEDLKFSIGTGQWDESVKANREIEGKPCLVVNRAPSFLRQYTGEERQNRPAMLVDPVGSGADEEVANIFQGVLRHIEVASMADTVYDNSYDMMLRVGVDYWRIDQQYLSEEPGPNSIAFQQEPRIVGIENPFAVYMSPVRQPDGTDPLWTHVVQDLGEDEYKEKFPNSRVTKMGFANTKGNSEPTWVVKNGVRIAEYWYLDLKAEELLLLDQGGVMLARDFAKKKLDKGMIVGRRDSVQREVKWVKHNAVEVLERKEYSGHYIPIIELNGLKLHVDGGIYRSGIIRDYRDAQRIYDFMVTRAVEQVDLFGKDPLFVAEGSIAGHEEEYRQMNRKNWPYLYYKATDGDGHQIPPPTRANREPPIQAMQALIHQADYDMKAVIGVYGTGPGEVPKANESAFAVMTREQQTNTGTVAWADNLNRAIRWQGKMLIDLWPKLIDAPRVQRIINPDDSVKHAVVMNSKLGGETDASDAQAMLNQAMRKVYDFGTGDYDVTMSTGPAYRTARKEAFKAIGALIESEPSLFPILGDIWIKYGDFPGAHALADRLKKMVPPNLQDDDGTDPNQKIAALQATMAQLGQERQQLVAELQRAVDTIRTKRLELESKERVAAMQAQAGITESMVKANAEGALAAAKAQFDSITDRLVKLHDTLTLEQDAGAATETPELPGQVEPKVQPITPAAPTVPVPGSTGGPQ